MAIQFTVPGVRSFDIRHIVFDLNGTLAYKGAISEKSRALLKKLSQHASLYVITADTHGTAPMIQEQLGTAVKVEVLAGNETAKEKQRLVQHLGTDHTAALGNGANDVNMLEEAVLSFAVMGGEGCYGPLLTQADIVVTDTHHALEMLLNPDMIRATMRK